MEVEVDGRECCCWNVGLCLSARWVWTVEIAATIDPQKTVDLPAPFLIRLLTSLGRLLGLDSCLFQPLLLAILRLQSLQMLL